MLSERLCQILTAYVDGELNPHQRRTVEQLLSQSAEARALVEQLQNDAAALRRLPRCSPGRDLTDRVLRSIAERGLRPSRSSVPGRAIPAWAGLSAAAAILCAVGMGSYLFFSMTAQNRRIEMAEAAQPDAARTSDRAKKPEAEPPARIVQNPSKFPLTTSEQPEENSADSKPTTDKPALASQPTPEDVLANPVRPVPRIEEAQARIPLSLALRELDQDKPKKELLAELQKDSAYRLELFCLDNVRGFERLEREFKVAGIQLLVDHQAQARLKNRLLKTDYVFFTENLAPKELAKIMERMGTEDKKMDSKRRGDGVFNKVYVRPLVVTDREELAKLMGIDPLMPAPSKPKTPLGVDIRKPIAETTAEQLVQALAGQGTPRPEPGKSAIVSSKEPLALVLAVHPSRPQAGFSREIKLFLDARKERRKSTIQLFLILRGA